MKTVKSNLICKPVVADSRSLIDGLSTVGMKKSGTCTDCSYWGWYGKQRNFYPGQWVFSFARMTDDEWLLISAAEIVDVPADEWVTVNVLDYHRLADIFNGRILPTYYEALKKITGFTA